MAPTRNPHRAPTHPGAVLLNDVLPALRISQTEFARLLGVSRVTVYELLHEKRALTPEMAVRIATLLRGKPEIWVLMQLERDLWEARHRSDLSAIKPLDRRILEAA